MLSLRALASVCAIVLVAACVTTPSESVPPVLMLDAQGIEHTASQTRLDFGRAQDGVIDSISRVLNERPASITTNAECGAGPVTAAAWPDGLTLNFQQDAFVGWVNSDPELDVAGGFRAGQPRVEMPQVSFQVTTLGSEFSRSDVSGILTEDDARVRLLWAGTTCFFR